MSVAWFTRLYRLNDTGRYDEAAALSARYLKKRPRDYALHLQRAKALLSLGELEAARTHLDAAVQWSKGLAAWPWFYRAGLHARLGERKAMYVALETAVRLDGRLRDACRENPLFAAHWAATTFKRLTSDPSGPRRDLPGRASVPPPAAAPRKAPRPSTPRASRRPSGRPPRASTRKTGSAPRRR